jgi:hypothetical protein
MAEKIEICEMPDDMKDEAIREASNAAEAAHSEKDISKAIKKYFDNK